MTDLAEHRTLPLQPDAHLAGAVDRLRHESSGVFAAETVAGAPSPTPLVPESGGAADVVVTVGCGDACPVVPGRRYLDGDLPAPGDLHSSSTC